MECLEVIELELDVGKALDAFANEVIPELIYLDAKGNQLNATALAAAVVGDIIKAVFDRFEDDNNEEETPHENQSDACTAETQRCASENQTKSGRPGNGARNGQQSTGENDKDL